jgi:hypothetical protein
MKKLLCAASCFLMFLCNLNATEKTAFESTLTKLKSNLENFQDNKFQESLIKKEEDKKKFKNLSELEKKTYTLIFGIEINAKLTNLHSIWQEELKKATDDCEEIEANKEEIQKYIDELLEIRKDYAVKVEEVAVQLFKDYPNNFTKEEQEFTLKKLKDFKESLKGK